MEQAFLQRRYTNSYNKHIISRPGDANQNCREVPLHTHLRGYNKNKLTGVDKDVEKLEHSFVAGGDIKQCSHFGK